MDMLKFYLSTTFQKRRRSKLTGIPVDAGHSRSGGPKLFPIAVTLLNCMWEVWCTFCMDYNSHRGNCMTTTTTMTSVTFDWLTFILFKNSNKGELFLHDYVCLQFFYIEFLVSIVVLVFLKCIFSCVLVGTSLKVILWNELKYELEKVAFRKTLKELCVQEREEKELKEENEEEVGIDT